jgi:hypothetical protein
LPERTLLLPQAPRKDLLDLILSQGISLVCAQETGFGVVPAVPKAATRK